MRTTKPSVSLHTDCVFSVLTVCLQPTRINRLDLR